MKNNTRQPGRLMLTEDTHRKNKCVKGGRREGSQNEKEGIKIPGPLEEEMFPEH